MQAQKENVTVLLLSAPIGSGHKLAAAALEQYLAKQPNVRVVHGNIFDFFPNILGQTFLKVYLWILQVCPFVYEYAYKWGNNEGGSEWLRSFINKTLLFLGKGYLDKVQPDAVIATHATPAGIIAEYKKKHPELFLGAVVTDFNILRWWLWEGVDTYFIADELLTDRITKNAEVKAWGIPVRHEFAEQDNAACRKQYGWRDDERIILLMGGGEGLLPMADIIQAILPVLDDNLRLIAVTGHNEKLEGKLKARFGDKVEIYGYRRDVPQMMAGADMIITKAGGLTASEVLASDLDFIIYKPLPGQEQGNAVFLHEHCGAYVARTLDDLATCVTNTTKGAENASLRRAHAHPMATQKICEYVLSKIKNGK